MKCQYCGGDVSLDDKICPHCGRVQPNAVRHEEEMQRYETAFEDTRREVLAKASQSTRGIAARLLVIVLLLVGTTALFLNSDSWSIRHAKREREANAHLTEFTQKIESYIEARDYAGLDSFAEYYDLTDNNNYKKYYMILWAASDYENVCEALMEFVYADSEKLRTGELDYKAENLPRYLTGYYKNTDPESYRWNDRIDKEKTQQVIAQMDEDLAGLMQAHLCLSREEAESLRTLSEGRRAVLIEEAENARIQEHRKTE